MAVEDDFAKLQGQFGQFQQQMEAIQGRLAPDDPQAEHVRAMKGLLQKKFEEFVRMFQSENKHLDAELAQAKGQVQKGQAAIEAARNKPPEAPTPPAAPAASPIDPDLGTKLRAQLLKEMQEKPSQGGTEEGDVAGMESSIWRYEWGNEPANPTDQSKPGAEAKPQRQPRKPRVGGESFEWESTGEWEK